MAESTDLEVAAMEAIAAQLAQLDRAACDRVLSWAEQRYVRLHFPDGDLDGITRFADALVEATRQIGDVTPRELVTFAQQVLDARQAGEL